MLFLILCILSCTVINIIFKLAENSGKNSFYIIMVNYIVAVITGILTAGYDNQLIKGIVPENLIMVILLGILFIVMIYLISKSVVEAGVSKTAIATRMSMVIPIIFSYFVFKEQITFLKALGIISALVALYLTLFKKENKNFSQASFILPVIIFFGAGSIDAMIKYSQEVFVNDSNLPLFSTLIFAIAGITGIFLMIIKSMSWKLFNDKWIWIYGSILGIANYGTVFFFVKALEKSGMSTSVVFGINHTAIVLLSVLIAWILFKEKLSIVNRIGVLLAIASIILLIY